MEKAPVYSKWLLFPSCCWARKAYFLNLHHVNLVEFLEVKFISAGVFLRLLPSRVSHSHARTCWAPSNLSKLPLIFPISLWPQMFLLQVSSQLFLSGQDFFFIFSYLKGPKNLLIFQIVQFFVGVRIGVIIFKLFICPSWNSPKLTSFDTWLSQAHCW